MQQTQMHVHINYNISFTNYRQTKIVICEGIEPTITQMSYKIRLQNHLQAIIEQLGNKRLNYKLKMVSIWDH